MDKEQSRKYGIPIYTQTQVDDLKKMYISLICAAMFFAFCLGFVCGHLDLQKLADFFR
jgi:hypothetical protein